VVFRLEVCSWWGRMRMVVESVYGTSLCAVAMACPMALHMRAWWYYGLAMLARSQVKGALVLWDHSPSSKTSNIEGPFS
jgi:hypothetical protein